MKVGVPAHAGLNGFESVVDFELPEGFEGSLRIYFFCWFALIFVVGRDKWATGRLPAGMQLLRAAPGTPPDAPPVEPDLDDFLVDCRDNADFVVTLGGRPFVVLLSDIQTAVAVVPGTQEEHPFNPVSE